MYNNNIIIKMFNHHILALKMNYNVFVHFDGYLFEGPLKIKKGFSP